jgi:hypothetical protein
MDIKVISYREDKVSNPSNHRTLLEYFCIIWVSHSEAPTWRPGDPPHLGVDKPAKHRRVALSPLPFWPHFSPRLPLQPTKITLIHQKPALLFCDTPDLTSVWPYRAISRLKMTSNSTNWFEDNPENGLTILNGLPQKFTQQKTAHSRDLQGNPLRPRWAGRSGGSEWWFWDPPISRSRMPVGIPRQTYVS